MIWKFLDSLRPGLAKGCIVAVPLGTLLWALAYVGVRVVAA